MHIRPKPSALASVVWPEPHVPIIVRPLFVIPAGSVVSTYWQYRTGTWMMRSVSCRHCKCGAVYRRTESMANSRELNSFECIHCGETLENWNSAWVPTYRLVVGPA